MRLEGVEGDPPMLGDQGSFLKGWHHNRNIKDDEEGAR